MKIDSKLTIGCFAFLMVSCTHQPGRLAPDLSEQTYFSIAENAVAQLIVHYPPAKTRLIIETGALDAFHQALIKQLRHSGYAIDEKSNPSTESTAQEPSLPAEGLHLTAIVNPLTDLSFYGLYRLTLKIDNAELSRLFDRNHLDQAQYWTYRR
jgi:hypothetical protein